MPLVAAATTSSSRCGFCIRRCCKIWSAPFWTTMAPNKWSSIASELHVRWLQSPADVRFGPIASEIRHRSEMSRCATTGLMHCSKQRFQGCDDLFDHLVGALLKKPWDVQP